MKREGDTTMPLWQFWCAMLPFYGFSVRPIILPYKRAEDVARKYKRLYSISTDWKNLHEGFWQFSLESELSPECSFRFWLSAISQRDLVYLKVHETRFTVNAQRSMFQTRHTIRIDSHRCNFGITQSHRCEKAKWSAEKDKSCAVVWWFSECPSL